MKIKPIIDIKEIIRRSGLAVGALPFTTLDALYSSTSLILKVGLKAGLKAGFTAGGYGFFALGTLLNKNDKHESWLDIPKAILCFLVGGILGLAVGFTTLIITTPIITTATTILAIPNYVLNVYTAIVYGEISTVRSRLNDKLHFDESEDRWTINHAIKTTYDAQKYANELLQYLSQDKNNILMTTDTLDSYLPKIKHSTLMTTKPVHVIDEFCKATLPGGTKFSTNINGYVSNINFASQQQKQQTEIESVHYKNSLTDFVSGKSFSCATRNRCMQGASKIAVRMS